MADTGIRYRMWRRRVVLSPLNIGIGIIFHIQVYRHVASFWKFGEEAGATSLKKTLTSKKKKGKKENSEILKSGGGGLHYNSILYV